MKYSINYTDTGDTMNDTTNEHEEIKTVTSTGDESNTCISRNNGHPSDAITYPVGKARESDGEYGLFWVTEESTLTCKGKCMDCGDTVLVVFKQSEIRMM